MSAISLRADCARCAALCCVALAFDSSSLFGFDKPAGEPCRHLDACDRCRIHAELPGHGFEGCARFDCRGAGPYVTQQLFGGRSWRDEPALLQPMTAAFSAVRQAHELLHALLRARALSLPRQTQAELAAIARTLQPAGGWSRADAACGAIDAAVAEARRRLRALAIRSSLPNRVARSPSPRLSGGRPAGPGP